MSGYPVVWSQWLRLNLPLVDSIHLCQTTFQPPHTHHRVRLTLHGDYPFDDAGHANPDELQGRYYTVPLGTEMDTGVSVMSMQEQSRNGAAMNLPYNPYHQPTSTIPEEAWAYANGGGLSGNVDEFGGGEVGDVGGGMTDEDGEDEELDDEGDDADMSDTNSEVEDVDPSFAHLTAPLRVPTSAEFYVDFFESGYTRPNCLDRTTAGMLANTHHIFCEFAPSDRSSGSQEGQHRQQEPSSPQDGEGGGVHSGGGGAVVVACTCQQQPRTDGGGDGGNCEGEHDVVTCQVCLEDTIRVDSRSRSRNRDSVSRGRELGREPAMARILRQASLESICLPCAHVFHTNCIITWFKRSRQCPTCRFEVTQESIQVAVTCAEHYRANKTEDLGSWTHFLNQTLAQHR